MIDRLILRFVLTVAFVLAVSISVLAVLYARADITGRRALELEAGPALFIQFELAVEIAKGQSAPC